MDFQEIYFNTQTTMLPAFPHFRLGPYKLWERKLELLPSCTEMATNNLQLTFPSVVVTTRCRPGERDGEGGEVRGEEGEVRDPGRWRDVLGETVAWV